MLGKLGPQSLAHEVIFDGLPVWSQWTFATSPHAGSDHWRFGKSHGFLMFRPDKFLRLEVVLGGGPNSTFQLNRVWREVGETAKGLVYSIKADLFHFACFGPALNSAITSIAPTILLFI